MKYKKFDTLAIHAGESTDPHTGAVDTPIYQATTFAYESADEGAERFAHGTGFVYTRWGNPNISALQEKIAALEGGEACLATATGMAAVATTILQLVQSGDHIVASNYLYSATNTLCAKYLPKFGVQTTFVDTSNPKNVERAIQKNTKLIYIETPSNPALQITDIKAITTLSKQAGLLSLIDNTFATPFNQKPIALGLDLVIHSATKFLCGHGDAMGGAVIGKKDLIEQITKGMHRDLGGVISPFNAWLIARGIKTLSVRMERHNRNALEVARFLQRHPKVERVYYPGLPEHPGHEIAKKQMVGFSGVMSFEVKGGYESGKRTVNALKLCTQAVSLGDTRTLVCHSASTTHSTVTPEARRAGGITDGLIRLSVGLEDPQDIIADLDQALG
ncbi:aminotransferase class I/II-fold pyridoxal phosphate-dependent enzyme [Candidatus Acetothermia bacterium]|nr:aminotransferase class I/II-fold pyridoxal phosphate-dependent enzyme [Candidatus Acetothermia bacterium]